MEDGIFNFLLTVLIVSARVKERRVLQSLFFFLLFDYKIIYDRTNHEVKRHLQRRERYNMASEWFFEYEIQVNRPGLLGDISSLLGMLRVNIVTINGVDEGRRGMLIKAEKKKILNVLNILFLLWKRFS